MDESNVSLWERVKPWLLPTKPSPRPAKRVPESASRLPPGLHHYRLERNGQMLRFHLRVENSGQALLLAAAVEAVRLTQSGAVAAYGILEGQPDSQVMQALGDISNGAQVISEVRSLISELGSTSKRYPVFNLADPVSSDLPYGLIAPFQADLVLGTWDLTRLCLHSLWNAGIPHVRFLVDDYSGRDHAQIDVLCSAIELAEDIGMIAGVRMKAGQLMEFDHERGISVLDRIAALGVDYVVVPWAVTKESHTELFGESDFLSIRPVLQSANRWEVTTVLEAGLTQQSASVFEVELDTMRAMGIEYLEVFAVAHTVSETTQDGNLSGPLAMNSMPFEHQQLRQLAGWIEDLSENRRVQIIWLPPVSKCGELTAELVNGLIRRGPRAGADISIRVEADGQVIPPRGPGKSVGKIHQMPWDEIWSHPAFLRFRKMVSRVDHCAECPMLTICAEHCPADQQGWAIEE